MAREIIIKECMCGRRFEKQSDGSFEGAKIEEWNISDINRLYPNRIAVKFTREHQCPECYDVLKKERASKTVIVTPNPDTIAEFTQE